MHTFKGDKGNVFIYNSDFSGEVIVQDIAGNEVKIDGSDILDFVAYCFVLGGKIEKLDDLAIDRFNKNNENEDKEE